MSGRKLLIRIFDTLLQNYGPRKWWPAKTRFEVIVGAILTQNVSWKNAKIAVDNLRKAGLLSPNAVVLAKHEVIARSIKTSRFYNQKTQKLKVFCDYLMDKYSGSLSKMFLKETEVLRKELLELRGIGKETADSILLYAGNKLSFVSDAYTERFLERFGLLNGMESYDEIRKYFMNNLPQNIYIYNEFHALIVHHCYATCRAVPNCDRCSVKLVDRSTFCDFGVKRGGDE